MTLSTRRRFIALLAAAMSACSKDGPDKSTPRPRMRPTELTEEEFKLLENPAERKRIIGDGPLTIKGKLLGPPHRLDKITLQDVHFEDCDFLGHQMFNVNLTNVSFTRCAIVGTRWEDGQWNDVSFVECDGRGEGLSLLGGGGTASTTYDKCKFYGEDPPEPQYVDAVRFHGYVSGCGKSRFTNCEFTRIHVMLTGQGEFKNCKFLSVAMQPTRVNVPVESINIEDCSGKYTLWLSNRSINSVTLKNGNYQQVDMSFLKANSVVLEGVSGDFDISVLDALNFSATSCTFKAATHELDKRETGGLLAPVAMIDKFSLVDCKFEGPLAKFSVAGDPPKLDSDGKVVVEISKKTKKPVRYATEIGTLALQKTTLTKADFGYAHIKHLFLEEAAMADTAIAHSEIGKLTMKNVKLSGKLDFSDTKVKEVVTENVTRDKLTIVKDKATQVELTASSANEQSSGPRRWLA